MGAAVISAFNPSAICSDCARFVCNSMRIHSQCSDCFECDFVTEEIEVPEDHHSETELEVQDCCVFREK